MAEARRCKTDIFPVLQSSSATSPYLLSWLQIVCSQSIRACKVPVCLCVRVCASNLSGQNFALCKCFNYLQETNRRGDSDINGCIGQNTTAYGRKEKQQLGNCYFEYPKSALFLPPVFPKLCSAHAVWNAIHHQERKFVYFRLTAELSD